MDRSDQIPPVVVQHPDVYGRPLTVFGVGDMIWKLHKTDKAAFKAEMERYCSLCMPGYKIVKLVYPNVHLQDERLPEIK